MPKLLSACVMSLGFLAAPAFFGGAAQAGKPPAAPPALAAPPVVPAVAVNKPPPGKGHFMGAHPLAGHAGAGYCYIDVPHTHDYLPDRPALYQQVGDSYVFTGDPVPFGYEGDKTVFYGHHPVPVVVEAPAGVNGPPGPTFCFMKGPHYHEYPAPEGGGYKQENNVVFYVGPIPPEAARVRPQAEQALEVEYRPYLAERPKVVVTPPPEWPGVVWTPPPPSVVIAAPAPPSITVSTPAPPSVTVGVPSIPSAVVVAPPFPTVVVAPPIPSVVIGAPGQVIIGGPAPVFMGGPVFGPGHGPHGPGRGPGWGKGHWKGGGHWRH